MNLAQVREKVDGLLGEYSSIKRSIRDERENLELAEERKTHLEEAQVIAQKVSAFVQQQAHARIAGVVSRCIATVFPGEGYDFDIRFETKRGRTEAKLLLLKDGHEVEDPMNEDSGGVVDVAAFALRLSCLLLTKPPLRRVIFLDEPFKFVSEGYRENVRQMLESLAKDFKIQIVMVTHITELETGRIIKL